MKLKVFTISLLTSALLSVAEAQSHTYTAVDLGTLGGQSSEAWGINPNTERFSPIDPSTLWVVGDSSTAGDKAVHAFLWTPNNGMQDLGTLGGSFSSALAVNRRQQVVGYSSTKNDAAIHAFLWTSDKGMQDLGTLGGNLSVASSIDDGGAVVGWSTRSRDTIEHVFRWTRRFGMQDMAINGEARDNSYNSDAFVGVSHNHAFRWSKRGGFLDLGTLGGSLSVATAISPCTGVVGFSQTANNTETHAFLWSSNHIRDLGTLGGTFSRADSLPYTNCSFAGPAPIVGSSTISPGGPLRAFVWSSKQGMQDLNDLVMSNSGLTLLRATGISNEAEIVGIASTGQGKTHAFLLQ